MRIETKTSEIDNVFNLDLSDCGFGIYIPQGMPEVRIIMMDDTNLYIDTDGVIESLDYDAWKSHKFMAAPVGDKTTVSFIQE